MSMTRAVVRGIGSYLPERVLTNAELSRMVDTSDEWIVQRTGIEQRHIAAEGETTSQLAVKAAERALADAGIDASAIDLIVLATATPDHTFPSTATQVQAALGITKGVAFDVAAVCSGFVFALSVAEKFIASGSHRCALVIGAETFSRILDWSDRTTCVLFGDGAGAVVLEAAQGGGLLPIAAYLPRICAPMAGTNPSFLSMAGRRAQVRSVICGWKARKSSSMRSA